MQIAIGSGLIACALAQSGHQTIFFLASLALCGAVRFWRPKVLLTSTALVTVTAVAMLHFYPATIELSASTPLTTAKKRNTSS